MVDTKLKKEDYLLFSSFSMMTFKLWVFAIVSKVSTIKCLFIIYPQNTNEESKKLIEDNVIFVQYYCKKNNLKLLDFVYTPSFDNSSSTVFVEFYIKYNNYKYKFALAKYNQSYTWKVILKNKKIYKINCYLKDDFKHLVQAMFEDNKRK